MHHLGAGELEAVASQDVRLHGDVGNVVLLHRRARLHLDEAKPAVIPREDIHRDKDAVRPEGGLVHRRSTFVDRPPGEGDTLVVGAVREVDDEPAGHIGAGDLADTSAPIHRRLGLVIRLQLGRGRLVHHPPQQLVALQPRHHA